MVNDLIRVIGGKVRGRKLHSPKEFNFRPTTGKVKEFLFSILAQQIGGAYILDLFSGTGSLGIEALSRGAEKVTFIERSRKNIQLIKKNLHVCEFLNHTEMIQGDVFAQLKILANHERGFDFIIADPPFQRNLRTRIVQSVWKARILKREGLLIIEHESHDNDDGDHQYHLIRQKKFGQSVVSIYQSKRL